MVAKTAPEQQNLRRSVISTFQIKSFLIYLV